MRFIFIEQHRREFPVYVMCRVLRVSRSGYYAWRQRPISDQRTRRDTLTAQIHHAHETSRSIYGSPRVHKALLQRGVRVCVNTVARLMRQIGLRSKAIRRFRATTNSQHAHPVASNTLDRQFTVTKLNTVWASDITYVPTGDGWLYLAVVLDVCSRRVIGYAMSDSMKVSLTLNALQMALTNRHRNVNNDDTNRALLHHSDRGVQYAAREYQELLRVNGIVCSMSRKGNCWDNAVVESFFSSLKRELVHHERYGSRSAAKKSLFEYIEVFYNRQRLHSTLGDIPPVEFENLVT